ncbi:UvrD-helicase domain-containing protein [Coxiella burnetii]|uniref:UvrD-helicase domain-containing protein n=1 Tax=Coxiella burnetii TaxID=777 RepID=UPI000183CDEC|nr:UvrD-helicase domain-containing protein [Coxiella burnetii]ACJ18176.1 ATP-dependent nuclease subunit A [Coxiella burnetii CbuG_Q212]ATN66569.1 ATP-dependent helicase [Coxiella burnetii]OYK86481.1 ATP-dependent helicase [Coxiella burnetii]
MNDKIIRQQALDPQQSFIVQAPAGSGKTELLIQRFLKLLATAKMPEEIIAITFTRKAAAEMRERIIAALNEAQTQPAPSDSHKKLTWTLARKVIERNQHYDWQLDMNPNRLRLLTIDALANQICSQMPILCGFGAPPSTLEPEEIVEFYREAVIRFFESEEHADTIEELLLHLDNKAESLETLLIKMLIRREQWLPHIINHYRNPNAIKNELEKALATITLDALQTARMLIDPSTADELVSLAQFAGHNLHKIKPTEAISACHALTTLPGVGIDEADLWRGIATLFLTKEGLWRKKLDKNDGFPVEDKKHKQRMKDLLSQLNKNEKLRLALNEVKNCPPIAYTEKQWNIIHGLVSILPILTAQLNVIFQERNAVDFTEVTLGAIRALGDSEQPSDYALQLDEQIQHLLIDEFQDTSIIQFHLIEKLITGWQPKDGRTLFLVGDPMQSIYRFRQAEVGLFLQVKNEGLGEIQLTPLTLRNNFRSQKNLIDWFNQTFEPTFPKEENSHLGSISYSHSFATNNSINQKNINFYSLLNANALNEATQIVKIIQGCRSENPEKTIAILVRSRSQLIEITPALRSADIPFHAVEIEKLAHRIEIQDLLSLTRALHHLGDRIAWLALLRAPWCGLTLQDLHAVSRYANDKPIWVALQNASEIAVLTSDGKNRINRIFSILSAAFDNRDRLLLAQWIEGIWTALGGPACLSNSTELMNTQAYFQLLETLENDFTLERLTQKLNQLYAQIDTDAKNPIQIMTIHKAKGLEFDHVILPGLEKRPRSDDHDLLLWLERHTKAGNNELILAPLKAASEKADPVYNYLKRIEKEKTTNEITRLLYVAATRAKESFHLLTSLNKEDPQSPIKLPPKGSFAEILWPVCQEAFEQSIIIFDDTLPSQKGGLKLLRRLTSDWAPPFILKTLPSPESKPLTPFTPASSKRLGIVIHETLERIANEGLESWDKERIENNKSFWQRRLIQLGTSPEQLAHYLNGIITAVSQTLCDAKGRWILSHRHNQKSEYPITLVEDKKIKHFIIDCTFIDEAGTRWIIDYKSATPNDEPLDLFLQRQRSVHEAQLQQYANAFHALDSRPIKLGLYFPLCQGWCEWALELHKYLSEMQ